MDRSINWPEIEMEIDGRFFGQLQYGSRVFQAGFSGGFQFFRQGFSGWFVQVCPGFPPFFSTVSALSHLNRALNLYCLLYE